MPPTDESPSMDDTKPAQTGAQRQRKYAAKKRLASDAARRAFFLAQTEILLGRYQAMLATEARINPQSRFVALIMKRVAALEAVLRRP